VFVEWLRHGQSLANLTETLSHRSFDGDLTTSGRMQAHTWGKALRDSRSGVPRVLVCSPLRRARQTADIVGDHLGLSVELEVDEFREVDIGTLDGRGDAESWRTYVDVLGAWRRGDPTRRFPGGEDYLGLCARLRTGLERVLAVAGERDALVVAHGANIRAALPGLAGATEVGEGRVAAGIARFHVTPHSSGGVHVQLLAPAA
jgi:broad specificity phosphatase PhoE